MAVVLGFMIFVHELGHFLVAKRLGVRVLTFSLGFGQRLFGFEHGGTDYRVSLLPLGGYVKMSGEDPTESHHDDPGDFLAHPRWHRFLIAIAGPAMNLLTAFVLLAFLYKFHYEKPAYDEGPARVGEVQPGSPAQQAGLKRGDLIVRMGKADNPKWDEIELKVLMTTHESIPIVVDRNGQTLNLSLRPKAEGEDQTGYAGLGPCLPPDVGAVESGMPGSRVGLKSGDKIVALDGVPIRCFQELETLIQKKGGQVAHLAILRRGSDVHLNVQPVEQTEQGQKRWVIGFYPADDTVVRSLPVGQAVSASWNENVRTTALTFETIEMILARKMSARSLAGPVGIAQLSGTAYREGITVLLSFVAFISLQLAILNLLPIPMLDGGMVLMLLVEAAMQRDLSLQFKERVIQAGILLLLLLVVFVTYNDIIRAIGHS